LSRLEQNALPLRMRRQEQRTETTSEDSVSSGNQTNKCCRCGRALKDHKSMERGMGPVCWVRARRDDLPTPYVLPDKESE